MTDNLRLLPLGIAAVLVILGFKAYEIGRDLRFSPDGLSVKQSQAQSGDREPLRLLEPIDESLGGFAGASSTKIDNAAMSQTVGTAVSGTTAGSTLPRTAEGVRPDRGGEKALGQQFAQADFGGVTPPTGEGTPEPEPMVDGAETGVEQIKRSDLKANLDELSQQEIDALLLLRARREEIERIERDLEHKRRLLQAAEQRVDEKIEELNNLKITIEGLLVQRDQEQEEKVASLVKIFETMKPRDAANIFNGLDMLVLLGVADRMNARKLAPILGDMDAQVARRITQELMQRRDLPVPRE